MPEHPLMETIQVFQKIILQKIAHFDKYVINFSKKLQLHNLELNNIVYKKNKASPNVQNAATSIGKKQHDLKASVNTLKSMIDPKQKRTTKLYKSKVKLRETFAPSTIHLRNKFSITEEQENEVI